MDCGTIAFINEQYEHKRCIVAAQKSFEKNYRMSKAPMKKVIRRCVRNFL